VKLLIKSGGTPYLTHVFIDDVEVVDVSRVAFAIGDDQVVRVSLEIAPMELEVDVADPQVKARFVLPTIPITEER